MILYVDIYIFINALCNLISFLCCGRILSLKIKKTRLFFSVAGMSLYALIQLEFSCFFISIINICVMAFGCIGAFGYSNLPSLLKICTVYFISSVMTGGVAGLLCGMSAAGTIIVIFLTPAVYFCWTLIVKCFEQKADYKSVDVIIDGKILCGLCDSGNLLREQKKGLCVIVANHEKLNMKETDDNFLISVKTACGTAVMPYYFPKSIKIQNKEVLAAVAVNFDNNLQFDCIVPTQLVI
ncbi:MAG: sigma-E processing peptidase SpoIIGA [Clostridia bacterium]|nr:sigma-E processing peptidase SpoIIGA [Clostridia bacterium]